MFKHLPLKKFAFVTALVFMGLYLFLTPRDAFAAEMTFDLAKGSNGISIPFENNAISDAERLWRYCQ